MSEILDLDIDGQQIKRLSDEAIEKAVNENKSKFSNELVSIDKSDLDRHVYEGGLKVWECSYDLAKHIKTMDLQNKVVLEVKNRKSYIYNQWSNCSLVVELLYHQ